jgi:hypothetical protein
MCAVETWAATSCVPATPHTAAAPRLNSVPAVSLHAEERGGNKRMNGSLNYFLALESEDERGAAVQNG